MNEADTSISRWELVLLVLILVAGAGLRLSYLAELRADPSFTRPAFDAAYHDYWAWGMVSGEWSRPMGLQDPRIPETPFFRPPAYPYLLAAVYSVAGRSELLPRLLQFLAGLTSALLGYRLGRRAFGAATGLTFAALLSLYWVFVFFEGELLAPSLLVFLMTSLLLVLYRLADSGGVVRAALAGVVLGIFSLARPNGLLLVPVVALWLLWLARRRDDFPGLRSAAIVVVVAVSVVLPAGIRNRVVAGEWAPITANAGINLYIGNNPQADGYSAAIPELEELTGRVGWTCFDYPNVVRALSERLGRPLSYREASRYWTRQAWAFIRENPGQFLRLTLRRAALFWGPREVGNNRDLHFVRQESRALNAIPLSFPLVAALALLGLIRFAWPDRLDASRQAATLRARRVELVVLAVAVVLVYFGSFAPFFFAARYRVPLLPPLMLGAALALVTLTRDLLSRRFVRAGAWASGGVLIWALASVNWAGYEHRRDEWHFYLGTAYGQQGDLEDAVREYRKTLELNPRHSVAHNNLGLALLKLGRADEAVVHLQTALQLNPRDPNAQFNLGAILLKLRRFTEAAQAYRIGLQGSPDDPFARVNLGAALLQLGELEQAREQLERAVAIEPRLPQARLNLGRVLLRLDEPESAAEELELAARLRPDSASAMYYLGLAQAQLGRVEQARSALKRALELRPSWNEVEQALLRLDAAEAPAR